MALQTNRLFQLVFAITGLLSLAASPAYAGFDFSFFRLTTFILDFRAPSTVSDSEGVDTPQSPLHEFQDTNLGPDYARTQFDVSWLEYTGAFNAEVDHHIEDVRFETVSNMRLQFVPDRDLLVDVDLDIDYSSSGADLADIETTFGIANLTDSSAGITYSQFFGGAGRLLPPSGNFKVDDQYLLPAGSLYQIDLNVKGYSGIDFPTHAPINITGHSYISIMPVPEPACVLLLTFPMFLLGVRRGRR